MAALPTAVSKLLRFRVSSSIVDIRSSLLFTILKLHDNSSLAPKNKQSILTHVIVYNAYLTSYYFNILELKTVN